MKNNRYMIPIIICVAFIVIALSLWLATGNIFYLFNFLYVGGVVSAGIILTIREYRHARLFVQFGVGLYMFGFLGLIQKENMQLEGFFFYLFIGVFQAAVIHYLVAKIAGPFLFGRGWCGYACWTAMALDFLPYKIPVGPRIKNFGMVRYIAFAGSLGMIILLFRYKPEHVEQTVFLMFIITNGIYFVFGTVLACFLKDNRAFCKYICPVSVFLKPASYFAWLRVKVDPAKCLSCGKCKKTCPMNVNMLDPGRNRENGAECILCLECSRVCPEKAINL